MKIASNLVCSAILMVLLMSPCVARAQVGLGEAATAVGAAAANNAATIAQGASVTKTAEQTVVGISGAAATSNPVALPANVPVSPPAGMGTAQVPVPPPPANPSSINLDASDDSVSAMGVGTMPGIASEEDKKTPDAVKNVMKRLNNSTSNITLEDLNAAREAVARVDMLIELEKKLKDLSEVRKDRKGSGGFEDALPASALNAKFPATPQAMTPPTLFQPATPVSPVMPPPSFSSDNIVVERIMGAGGRYAAMIKVNDGKATLARVGDELSDGSKVKAISDQGVTIESNKKSKTIKVRNVNNVFSSR